MRYVILLLAFLYIMMVASGVVCGISVWQATLNGPDLVFNIVAASFFGVMFIIQLVGCIKCTIEFNKIKCQLREEE